MNTPSAAIACKLDNIKKSYSSPGGGQNTTVLAGVDLTVAAGKTVGIVGPSGSGKSTLLNIIGCLDSQDDGTAFVADRDVSLLSAAERAEFRNTTIGFIFQMHHLLPQCTVLENVLIPTLMIHGKKKHHMDRAIGLLQKVGLARRIDHRPAQLSGGECLRAAVARALINSPKVLLADEPTGSLDSATSTSISELLLEMNRTEQTTLVVVTHSTQLASMLDVVYELRLGVLRS